MQSTVLLFDIDGTLLTTAGAGRRALQRAFGDRHQRPDAISQLRLDGMTDHSIVRLGLEAIGVEGSLGHIEEVIERYLEILIEEVASVPEEKYRVHVGIREALERVAGRPGTAIGLGTGNVKRGARIKLSRVALHECFTFGGFGCDAESRPDLLRRGAERGAEALGRPMDECRVVVIGDTPKDVAAAKAIGAICIGVGTGSFSAETLKESGADFAFPHLGSPGALDVLAPS